MDTNGDGVSWEDLWAAEEERVSGLILSPSSATTTGTAVRPCRPAHPRKLLILDIDETLVHAHSPGEGPMPSRPHDFTIFHDTKVFKRPYVDTFLLECTKLFHVGLWTASGDEYASAIADHLFPHVDEGKPLFVLSSSDCTRIQVGERQVVLKEVSKIHSMFGFHKDEIIIVDDTPSTSSRNLSNGLCVPPYWGTLGDDCLYHLLEFLKEAANSPRWGSSVVDKHHWLKKSKGKRRRQR